jgi:transposase InsO family protein
VPWKESHLMSERVQFVARLLKGERMTDLCVEFGISRKTGYKFLQRYKSEGVRGLEDVSRAPKRVARKTGSEMAQLLVRTRRAHPSWGGRKMSQILGEKYPELKLPAPSTIVAVLKQHGYVLPARRPREQNPHRYQGRLTSPQGPNDVWAADYKGQFRLGNRRYCYPLTASDLFSRYLLSTEALDGTDEEGARAVFEQVFRDYGLPLIIRTDNGSPFASRGLAGLTKVSAWWLRLGIKHERIEPGHPEQNGCHERMHRTLKAETTRPARQNSLQQQERFDEFRREFNEERPHEALGMKRPAQLYRRSDRYLPEPLPALTYPLHDDVLNVTHCGKIRLPGGRQVYLSQALACQDVGLRERADGRWLIAYATLDLGSFDPRTGAFETAIPSLPT